MDKRRMCPNCRAFITTDDKVCPYCNEKVAPRRVERTESGGSMLGGFIPQARFTTVMLVVVNFALYLATVAYSMSQGNSDAFMSLDSRTLFAFGGQNPMAIFGYHQWWRLITAGFLHGGLFHILMNMWVLFDLGAQVEEIYGGARLLVFFIVGTVFGFLCSAMVGTMLSVGASAGLFGMIGAMIALGVKHRHHPMGAAIRSLYLRWAIYGIILGFLPGLRMDNAAHIGGLVSGFLVAWVAGTPDLFSNVGEKFWRIASYACIGLTAFSFLRMYLSFSLIAH